MRETIALPALRPVDVVTVELEGEVRVVVRDPEGVFEHVMEVPLHVFFIASCFNGANSARDIQAAFQRQFGVVLKAADILSLSDQLDSHCLLQTERYAARRREIEADYTALLVRPAIHAGAAYPKDPEALRAAFDAYFTLDGGAGRPGPAAPDRALAGLVAPHMDPRCAGSCASWALKALAESPMPDVFVIFGTSHQTQNGLFSVSGKNYETPLGVVKSDQQFVESLRRSFGAQRLAGELSHKTEHSVEFAVVFLRALYDSVGADFAIVPILCGSFHEMILSGKPSSENSELSDFCQAVRRTAAASGKRVCCFASADLAHMGHKFGDAEGLSDALISRTRQADLEALDHAARLDKEAFFLSIAREKDARKICGLPPMLTMMSCIDAKEGKLLRYDYNLDPETQSLVSFCSMAFYG